MAYAPKIGGAHPVGFAPQFLDSITQSSFAVTPIELLSNDANKTTLSHASGFVWEARGQYYLITARHVLAGRDPFDDAPMSALGYFPRKIKIYPAFFDDAGSARRHNGLELSLYDGDARSWLEDPAFNELRTDIAAIPLPDAPIGFRYIPLNTPDAMNDRLVTMAGFECSILGYPNHNVEGFYTPIWRRGSFASEPSLAIDGKPMFLIDATTSPGFSGAPVLRRHIGPAPVRNDDNQITVLAANILTTQFVGVYCGRLQNKYLNGEVAFAFYGNRIPVLLG